MSNGNDDYRTRLTGIDPQTGQYRHPYNPEASQAELEAKRNVILTGIAKEMEPRWHETLSPEGYQAFGAPVRQVAMQRVAVPMQGAEAYSASAGISGPVGPAFPGMADLPGIQAKIQSFTGYMNMLTGPMVQQLLMFDQEALQEWYNSIGIEQTRGGA